MKPRLTQAVLGPVSEKRSSLFLTLLNGHLLIFSVQRLKPTPPTAFVLEGECLVQQEVVCLETGPYIMLW